MIGERHELVARFNLTENVPQLMDIRCIAHRKVLVVQDANKYFLDQAAN